MMPLIRKQNYIQNYYWYRNTFANSLYTASIFVTYYSIDWEKSIYDEKLKAMTYEQYKPDELSGLKWKEIKLVPIYNVEQVQYNYNAGEQGVDLQSARSAITLPSNIGIRPYPGDRIVFEQNYMFDKMTPGVNYIVTNFELDNHGDDKYYRVNIKVTDNPDYYDIKTKISDYLVYVELFSKIYDSTIANTLFNLQNKYDQLLDKNLSFKNNTGVYLQEVYQ